VVTKPKTKASVRIIKPPVIVIQVIKEWKEYIDEACPEHSDFAFCTRAGNLRAYSDLRSAFRRFMKKNGLDDKGLYLRSFRHTFATMLLENGVNPRVVQRLMGHSDIGMTLGTYSHVVREVYDEVSGVLGGIYDDTIDGSYKPCMTKDNRIITQMWEKTPDFEKKAV
jgi:integrase